MLFPYRFSCLITLLIRVLTEFERMAKLELSLEKEKI